MSAIKSILKENGLKWAINRELYSIKIKSLAIIPKTEKLYEKRVGYPTRLDIFHVNIKRLRGFIRCLPEEKKEELKNIADNAIEGKILGFSSVKLDYGNPIDWQLNPITGQRCDEKIKWYKIPDFDSERGDIKVIWEISRFSHFVTLARAYLLTEEKKYYRAFSIQLENWINKNPYSYGANYKCGQECSIRMANALLAYSVFRAVDLVTKKDEEHIRILILRCYRRILSNFFYAYKCIKNNHTISELLGLLIGAWCCGENERLQDVYEKLNEVVNNQFFSDGGYSQYSFNYQRLALQDIEYIIAISQKTGIGLKQSAIDKILKSANLLYQCQDLSGDLPNYGSNDGALVFPVTSCEYRDFRPTISGIYGLVGNQRLYEYGIYDEEYLWFSGANFIERTRVKERRVSCQYPDAGLFTIRSNNYWMMLVLNQFQSRPAQMDQMHIDLWINGVNVLCDTGTFSYADDLGKRMRSTLGHNTAVFDNIGQMNDQGAFMIFDRTKRLAYSLSDRKFHGYMRSQNGYDHIRDINGSDYGFEMIDQIVSHINKPYKIYFHTPCEIAKYKNGLALYHDGQMLCTIEADGFMETRKANRSLYYLRSEEINEIVVGGYSDHPITTKVKIILK